MSDEATALARVQRTGSARNKLVLLCLANYVPVHSSICFELTRQTLAFDTEMSLATLDRALDNLVQINLIFKENITTKDTGTKPSNYHLLFDNWLPLTIGSHNNTPSKAPLSGVVNLTRGVVNSTENPPKAPLSGVVNLTRGVVNMRTGGVNMRTGSNTPENPSELPKTINEKTGGGHQYEEPDYNLNHNLNQSAHTREDLSFDFRQVINCFNALAQKHVKIIAVDDDEIDGLQKPIEKILKSYGQERFLATIAKIEESHWLIGLTPDSQGCYFQLEIGFLLSPTNFLKCENDKYKTKTKKARSRKSTIQDTPAVDWEEILTRINGKKSALARQTWARVEVYLKQSDLAKQIIDAGQEAKLMVSLYNFYFPATGLKTDSAFDFTIADKFPDLFSRRQKNAGAA